MSHFSVMVITDNCPSNEELTAIMQPWHEFECTGTVDQYVQNIDIMEEALAEYDSYQTYRLRNLTTGEIEDWFDSSGNYRPGFYTEGDYGRKESITPPGYEEIKVFYKDVETFENFLSYYYGAELDGKYTRYTLDDNGEVNSVTKYTNPNKKWDWWQVGGRWSGAFADGYDPEKDPANQEVCFLCNGSGLRTDSVGAIARLQNPDYTCNGCQGAGITSKWPTKWRNHGNQAQIGALDLDSARESKGDEAGVRYDKFYSLVAGRSIPNWDALIEEHGVETARKIYWDSEVINDIKNDEEFRWADISDYECTREEYVERAKNMTYATFAFVRDGKWYERGEMGWFGTVYNESDKDTYYSDFAKMLDELPESTWLTIIDCHI